MLSIIFAFFAMTGLSRSIKILSDGNLCYLIYFGDSLISAVRNKIIATIPIAMPIGRRIYFVIWNRSRFNFLKIAAKIGFL